MIEVQDMSDADDADDAEKKLFSKFSFDDDGRVTLVLAHPIKFGEETITELRFREVTGKDMRSIKGGADAGAAIIMHLAGKCAGVPTQVIDQLRGADLRDVMTLIGGFMSGSLDAGNK